MGLVHVLFVPRKGRHAARHPPGDFARRQDVEAALQRRRPAGMGQIFRSTPAAYYEWHQVFKRGATYVLCSEVGVNRGARWRPGLAVSTDPCGDGRNSIWTPCCKRSGPGCTTTVRSITSPRRHFTRSKENGTFLRGLRAARQRQLHRRRLGDVGRGLQPRDSRAPGCAPVHPRSAGADRRCYPSSPVAERNGKVKAWRAAIGRGCPAPTRLARPAAGKATAPSRSLRMIDRDFSV